MGHRGGAQYGEPGRWGVGVGCRQSTLDGTQGRGVGLGDSPWGQALDEELGHETGSRGGGAAAWDETRGRGAGRLRRTR
ncbi:hypothetical protein GUJ93_ZPchr0236g16428 [Zizania palustris]|uniref:Uncharacterized protein n=1 Tax=Zizania palustris TaxID=103762 RepID=A0A8J5RFG4_ZIZPA|nr:hypothetical protein GUJ93_ZPchr0236g16428 [Zizania palustris]